MFKKVFNVLQKVTVCINKLRHDQSLFGSLQTLCTDILIIIEQLQFKLTFS